MSYEDDPSERYGGEEAEERERRAQDREDLAYDRDRDEIMTRSILSPEERVGTTAEKLTKDFLYFYYSGLYKGIKTGYNYGKHSNPKGDMEMQEELKDILKEIKANKTDRSPALHEEPGHEKPRV